MCVRPLVALLAVMVPTCVVAQDWSQWRGPNRDGHAPGSAPLISELPPAGLSPDWVSDEEIPTGSAGGWSSPVVASGRVFVFAHVKSRREGITLPEEKYPKLEDEARQKLSKEAYDEYEQNRREEQQRRRELEYRYDELLVCSDAQTGKRLWVNEAESRLTRYPQSASPAIVGNVAYVHGARGLVRAIDVRSGKDIWKLQLPGDFDEEPHPASVAAADGVVIVVAGRLFGINARTGKLLWKGEDEVKSGASPAVWRQDNRSYILAHAGKETICVDTADGNTLWKVESFAGRSSPVVVGNLLITYGNSRKGGLRCFAMSLEGGELQWTNTAVADEGSSPVVVGEYVYVHGDRRLVCVDLKNGKSQWRRELGIERPRYTSLIAADGKVIFAANGLISFAADDQRFRLLVNGRFDREGRLASEEYFREALNIDELEATAEGQKEAESLWRKQISGGGPAQCVSPAIADGKIYLRMKNNRLACYDLRLR